MLAHSDCEHFPAEINGTYSGDFNESKHRPVFGNLCSLKGNPESITKLIASSFELVSDVSN